MRGLARSKPAFKPTMLSAIVTISLRPLLAANFSDNLLTVFILHVLSVPALIHHVTVMSEEVRVTTYYMYSALLAWFREWSLFNNGEGGKKKIHHPPVVKK